jgi:hypothetical protein
MAAIPERPNEGQNEAFRHPKGRTEKQGSQRPSNPNEQQRPRTLIDEIAAEFPDRNVRPLLEKIVAELPTHEDERVDRQAFTRDPAAWIRKWHPEFSEEKMRNVIEQSTALVKLTLLRELQEREGR